MIEVKDYIKITVEQDANLAMVDVMIMVVVAPNLENISKINHVVVIMASVVLLRHIVGLYVPIKLWYGSNDRYDEKYGKFKIEKC